MLAQFSQAVLRANQKISLLLLSDKKSSFRKSLGRGFGGDVSIELDILAENIFRKHLHSFGNIYSEECGIIDNNSAYDIIIDPLDGSNNFVSNIPYFGTSVALKHKESTLVGIVANLANNTVFIRDQAGLFLADLQTLKKETISKNSYAKVGLFERVYSSTKLFGSLQKEDIKYRSLGAIALSLAYAHDVSFVLCEGQMRAFDIEAGLFLCKDLHIRVQSNCILVSKDKETFDKISQFI